MADEKIKGFFSADLRADERLEARLEIVDALLVKLRKFHHEEPEGG